MVNWVDRAMARPSEERRPPPNDESLVALCEADVPALASELIGTYLPSARLLGTRTGDRHVHEEHPWPREQVGQDAAEQQANGATSDCNRAPDAERGSALPAFGEGRGEDGQSRRRHECATETLQRASGNQHAGRAGEAVEQ